MYFKLYPLFFFDVLLQLLICGLHFLLIKCALTFIFFIIGPMQDLAVLIEFVQKTKFKSTSLLEVLLKPDSQLGVLFHALAKQPDLSDQELLRIFPDLGSLKQITTLKNRLKTRLCDSVFLLDFREEHSRDRQAAYIDCIRKWGAAMILTSKNVRSVGIRQLENLFRQTLEYEFTEISINIARILHLYYATIEGDQRKYVDLDTTLADLEATWLAERQMERLYSSLILYYVNSRGDKHTVAENEQAYLEKITPLMQQYGAFKIRFFGHLIKVVVYDSAHKFDEMEQACLDALADFDTKPYSSKMVQQSFFYYLLSCYLNTRQFDKAAPYFARLEALLDISTFNWFKAQEMFFITAMHSGNYADALTIWNKVQVNPSLREQPASVREPWSIYEAYLHYLAATGNLEDREESLAGFRMGRFVNDIQTFVKDKRGMNITLLVIQFLHLAAMRKHDECQDRVGALRKYAARYFNDDSTLRNRCFIRMLTQVPVNAFDANLVRRKTQQDMEFLKEMPWHAIRQHREVEVIPYEDLWEIVLLNLEQGNKGLKSKD